MKRLYEELAEEEAGPEPFAPELVSLLADWAQYPVHYVTGFLGGTPDPWQCDVLDDLADPEVLRIALRSCHGPGKTTLEAWATTWFTTTRPLAKVPTTAPTFARQVRDLLWAEIAKWWRNGQRNAPWFADQFELQTTRLQARGYADWYAVGIASREAVNMEGYHAPHILVVFDEAKGIRKPAWDAVRGMQAKHLVASTPSGKLGEFYKVFTQYRATWKHLYDIHPRCLQGHPKLNPEVVGQDPDTGAPTPGQHARGGTYFSDRVPAEWVEDHRLELGEDSPVFVARVMGEFPDIEGDVLLPAAWLERAIATSQGTGGPRWISVDVARHGRDRTVFLAGEGGTLLHCETVARYPDETTAPELKTLGVGPDPRHPLYRTVAATALICKRLHRDWGADGVAVDDSVTGDVPVIIRRQQRWLDVVPIASLHKKDSVLYRRHKGLEVLSATGWTPLVASRRHRVRKPIFDVVTTDGRTKVTGDHSLVVGGREMKVDALPLGTVVDTRRPTYDVGAAMPEDLAWALGLFAAEGSLSYHASTQHLLARIANSDLGLLLRAQRTFECYFCQARGISKSTRGVSALRLADEATRFVERWAFTTVNVRTWLPGVGHITRTERYKKVPVQVLNGPAATKTAWLEGYLAGDGILDRGHVRVDSVDLTLLAGVQLLWESLGFRTSVGVRGDKLNVTTLRRLTSRVDQGTRRGRDGAVKRIRPLGTRDDYVYDLETASHTFVAGLGFLVHHNTGVGGGVTDFLRWWGIPVVAVNFGAPPTDKPRDSDVRAMRARRGQLDTVFANLKAQMGVALQRAFESGSIALGRLPRHVLDALVAQASQVGIDYDVLGRPRLLDPDEREDEAFPGAAEMEGKRSPDHFHALLIYWWVAGRYYKPMTPRAAAPQVPAHIAQIGEPARGGGMGAQPGARPAAGKVGGQAGWVQRRYER